MRRSPAVARVVLVLLLLAPLANAAGQALKVLNLPDYGRWNRITSTALSPDGKWMSYAYQPNEGDATLFVKQLDGDKIFTIPIGSAPAAAVGDGGGGGRGGGGGGVQFSDDSRFVGYYVNPPEQAGGRGGRGGGGRGGAPQAGATAGAPRAVRRFEVLDLTNGEKFAVPNGASFKFAKGSAWLAVRLNKAPADTAFKGADLVLRDLKAATTRNIGNVNLYDFDDSGRLLAYTVDAAGHLGNGVYLMNLAGGDTRALNSSALEYDQLAWSDEGGNLLVLRGEKVQGDEKQRDKRCFAWTGAGYAKREKDLRARSVEGHVVPKRDGAERVHGAALEQGRLAHLPRHQGAGARNRGGGLVEGERRRLALEGSRAADGADRAAAAGAEGDAARRLSHHLAQTGEARRRRHAHRDSDPERQVGDRPERRRPTAARSNGARTRPTCIA